MYLTMHVFYIIQCTMQNVLSSDITCFRCDRNLSKNFFEIVEQLRSTGSDIDFLETCSLIEMIAQINILVVNVDVTQYAYK
jgi:hypothetical protein